MFVDQLKMKFEETSTIDKLLNKKHRHSDSDQKTSLPKSLRAAVRVLGGWTFLWFVPIPVDNDFSVENQLNQDY